MTRSVVAGQEIADRVAAMKIASVPSSYGLFESEALCAHQRRVSQQGFIEATIIQSNYGCSLRYASGLQNFGLIYSSRNGELDGTYEHALRRAQEWVAMDPAHRWVTTGHEGA